MNEERYGYIYKTTCINENSKLYGKYYIGQHKAKEFDTKYFGSGNIIKKYIKKYGTEGLVCEILEWANSKEELNELEAIYVTIDLVRNDIYMNECVGGSGGNFGSLTDEEKIKLYTNLSKHMKMLHANETFHNDWLQKNNNKDKLKRQSKSMKRLHATNKEYHDKCVERLHKGHMNAKDTKEYKNLLIQNSKRYYEEHPELKEKLAEGLKEKWKDAEFREKQSKKMSERTKEYFSIIDNRTHISKKRKEYLEKHPEERENMSKKMKEYYTNNENRKKMSDIQKQSYKDNPERHQRLSNGLKRKWQDQDYKQQRSDARKGAKWYTNGKINIIRHEHPGEGWIEGKCIKGQYHWYNNGIQNTLSLNPPGPEWKPGMLLQKKG